MARLSAEHQGGLHMTFPEEEQCLEYDTPLHFKVSLIVNCRALEVLQDCTAWMRICKRTCWTAESPPPNIRPLAHPSLGATRLAVRTWLCNRRPPVPGIDHNADEARVRHRQAISTGIDSNEAYLCIFISCKFKRAIDLRMNSKALHSQILRYYCHDPEIFASGSAGGSRHLSCQQTIALKRRRIQVRHLSHSCQRQTAVQNGTWRRLKSSRTLPWLPLRARFVLLLASNSTLSSIALSGLRSGQNRWVPGAMTEPHAAYISVELRAICLGSFRIISIQSHSLFVSSVREKRSLQTHAAASTAAIEPLGKNLQAEVGTSSTKVNTFTGLESDDVRHPLDAQNTRMLRRLPGLDFVARSLMGRHYSYDESFFVNK